MDRYCLGIDLGGTFIKFGLLSQDHRPNNTIQLPTPRRPEDVVAQMKTGAEQLLAERGLSRDVLIGLGIGSPGPLDLSAGMIVGMPNVPSMKNFPIRDRVGEAIGLPTVLENDANAAAYGEYLCGAGQDSRNMVLLTLGTGIGSGIILEGKVLHGTHGMGGEMGHMIVQPDGEPCGCGQRGCLERYASASHVAARATKLIRDRGDRGVLAQRLEDQGAITSKDILETAKAGDSLAVEVWDSATRYLAIGCVNICRTFDPDDIVLAGGMTAAGEDLLRPVQEHFEQEHWDLTPAKTEIALAALGNDAGAVGAAGVAWREFVGS
jgi:glucokinase